MELRTVDTGRRVLVVRQAEAGGEEEIEALFDRAMDVDQPPSAIVIVVPGDGADAALADMDLAAWDRVALAPLRGTFLLSRRAVEEFLAGGNGGRVVFVLERRGAADVLETALYSFARSIAKEYGRRGITCNVIVCGSAASAEAVGLADYLASDRASFVSGQLLQCAST